MAWIYKISQIASMTQEISEEVNRCIGLGPGQDRQGRVGPSSKEIDTISI